MLGKQYISDYDMMYVPDGDGQFTKEILDKMYGFIDFILQELNSKCKYQELNRLFKDKELNRLFKDKVTFLSETNNTMTIYDNPDVAFGNRTLESKTFSTYSSGLNAGTCFKISIIPNININIKKGANKSLRDDNVKFCLLRIKVMVQKGGITYSIPLFDLSYHFSGYDKDTIGDKIIQFSNNSYVFNTSEIKKILYSQLVTAIDRGDPAKRNKIINRMRGLGFGGGGKKKKNTKKKNKKRNIRKRKKTKKNKSKK